MDANSKECLKRTRPSSDAHVPPLPNHESNQDSHATSKPSESIFVLSSQDSSELDLDFSADLFESDFHAEDPSDTVLSFGTPIPSCSAPSSNSCVTEKTPLNPGLKLTPPERGGINRACPPQWNCTSLSKSSQPSEGSTPLTPLPLSSLKGRSPIPGSTSSCGTRLSTIVHSSTPVTSLPSCNQSSLSCKRQRRRIPGPAGLLPDLVGLMNLERCGPWVIL